MAHQVQISRTYILPNRYGLHGRTGRYIANPASHYCANKRLVRVSVTHQGSGWTVDGRSIVSLMALGAVKGDTIVMEVEGDKAEEFVAIVDDAFAHGLWEEENDIR
jgi:phosphotransferase system HPr (HPr) family protein